MPSTSSSSDQSLFHELSYYTLAHSDPGFIHQLAVDAYTAQTADSHTKPIALTFALAGLYLHLEKHYTGRQVQLAHMHLAKIRQSWPTFPLPDNRGDITVATVLAAPPGEERDAIIHSWCLSVWEAYAGSHTAVSTLIDPLLA